MSAHRRFKGVERAFAKLLGAERTGHLGGADITGSWFIVEVKTRQKLPGWIHDAMAQVEKHGDGAQLPIVILHQERQPYREAFLMMRAGAFVEWFGDGKPGGLVDLVDAAGAGDPAAGELLAVLAPDQLDGKFGDPE